MKTPHGIKRISLLLILLPLTVLVYGQRPHYDQTAPGFLVFHKIKTDPTGKILPWWSEHPAEAYNHTIGLVWNFWDSMRTDLNGLPYYMNHQVWVPRPNDIRGIGGDQFAMALSSWQLLYQFSGKEEVKENMRFIADYYLSHSLSSDTAAWANIPYPYNTLIYSGYYDGDMIEGKHVTQPDKAGSFGWELVKLYKLTLKKYDHWNSTRRYLDAAIQIANTLAKHTKPGNEKVSPMPFKVNAVSGRIANLSIPDKLNPRSSFADYTTNWSGTLELFASLTALGEGDTASYRNASDIILRWMKNYPMKNNQWGPFFEDVSGYSNTQINAITFAKYIMDHRAVFPDWKKDVNNIFDWVYKTLGNASWNSYGVTVVNEQTTYPVPANSHTAREAATELMYVFLSGDSSRKENAFRQLNWATYCVDDDGKNCFPTDDIWLTDGYGDFVRHYLRAMSFFPELAPAGEDHILSSTSVISEVYYKNENGAIYYRSYDSSGTEQIRLRARPVKIQAGKMNLAEGKTIHPDSWVWLPLSTGGLLTIQRASADEVIIFR